MTGRTQKFNVTFQVRIDCPNMGEGSATFYGGLTTQVFADNRDIAIGVASRWLIEVLSTDVCIVGVTVEAVV